MSLRENFLIQTNIHRKKLVFTSDTKKNGSLILRYFDAKYQVVDLLGSGATSQVYVVSDGEKLYNIKITYADFVAKEAVKDLRMRNRSGIRTLKSLGIDKEAILFEYRQLIPLEVFLGEYEIDVSINEYITAELISKIVEKIKLYESNFSRLGNLTQNSGLDIETGEIIMFDAY